MLTLEQALAEVANRSFYEDCLVSPNGDGTYTVYDALIDGTEEWYYTDTDATGPDVSERSRIMESCESFTFASHIRYHMAGAVEALEDGKAVEFGYALVSDSETGEFDNWLMVANY